MNEYEHEHEYKDEYELSEELDTRILKLMSENEQLEAKLEDRKKQLRDLIEDT
jgi:flagellar basal body-associated protein FliL